ncbi:MAG: alpha-L-rhamnosidase N-terminal domain-containing protein, partial [Victivallaceae bacterium]|nr:alpha-L-rhamnosidase N-terminal domain-containing protein [Victivallaceae bacterium]
MDIKAKWIWKKQDNYKLYNQTVIFRKTFEINSPLKSAELAITADSFYRLYVNGSRINDGPSRAYPEKYNYDLIDISARLLNGENEIYVIARYFGCGTFHQICQQAGFLAQLELEYCNGEKELLMSDSGWEAAEAAQWLRSMPRIYCQMEAVEGYNAGLEANIEFAPAAELFSADAAPWRGLMARDCPLLTGKEFYPERFHSANIVDCKGFSLEIPLPRLCYPGVIDMNSNTSAAGGIALIVEAEAAGELEIRGSYCEITVNGRKAENNKFKVSKGRNFLLALNEAVFSHIQQMTVFFAEKAGIKIYSPLDRNIAYPCFLRFRQLLGLRSDTVVRRYNPELLAFQDRIKAFYADILNNIKSEADFDKHLRKYAENIPEDCVLPMDFYPVLLEQKTGMDAACFIESPEKLIFDDSSCTVIHPAPAGDIRVIYDLGMQNTGYYDFELFAGEGTVLDIFEIEHIFSDGRFQDTGLYQNGMRYICKAGHNKFTSLKRRSGRYLIIVFRKLRSELRFRNFKLIESTYPAEYKGSFLCSDEFMNRLWKISAHTLKLCMEDTFTDCPLYEQTLWVGDARNEALFAYPVFGAWDLSRRCIRIAAESLARL